MINPLTTLFLLSSTIWGVSAVPRPDLRSRNGKFSIPAIRSDLLIHDGIKKLQRSELSDHNNSFLTTRQDGSVEAINFTKILFSSPATVGGQGINVLIDTGSSDMWVCSILQPPEQLDGSTCYDPTKRRTFINIGKQFSITYGDGATTTGKTAADTVTIGETTVLKQVFGMAADVISSEKVDGIVGLAFSRQSRIGTRSFLVNALPSLTNGLFTAYLPGHGIGAYDFGEIDNTKYKSAIIYAAVNPINGHWQIRSKAFRFGNIPWQNKSLFGFMDTGSFGLLLEPLLVFQYYNSGVEGWEFNTESKVYIFPCTAILPDFSFEIGDETYATIPGSDLNAGILPTDSTMCYGAIQTSPSIHYNVYGLPFFKNYFAIFDQSNLRFGFAPINQQRPINHQR